MNVSLSVFKTNPAKYFALANTTIKAGTDIEVITPKQLIDIIQKTG